MEHVRSTLPALIVLVDNSAWACRAD